MIKSNMQPKHIALAADDLCGNGALGRYIILTGSDGRARQIGEHLESLHIKPHPRQHNCYLGTLKQGACSLDVAVMSTGMGGSSADIIITELMLLGGSRFLRIGTAGSLCPSQVCPGDLVIASGAVRDDKASWDYIYKEYPAIASMECVRACQDAVQQLPPAAFKIHTGIVHSKSSFYARQYGFSLREDNHSYMNTLKQAGVLASEMECAQLFILSSLHTAFRATSHSPYPAIQSGAILAVIGTDTDFDKDKQLIEQTQEHAIALGLSSLIQMKIQDENAKR
ncbi:nucleoside phosphorylase [Legionella worsleiensis]|uniref:Purine nucleoside phosphorylase II n=1 Tax=Legionella worsleiensis TaxID=45076 RepID=A0A0W1AEE7_9GAMM|nr:nucleoside phosphorylase [Legionella worsleiensis]KTD79652.1 purine nucleoside phosphorylase II [Legionella worsleiensis]STY32162.1 purine nucleoside phosphorylase II [Legionella worsleiensis]